MRRDLVISQLIDIIDPVSWIKNVFNKWCIMVIDVISVVLHDSIATGIT